MADISPRKNIYATPLLVEAMEDSGSWTGADCTLSDELTNVRFYETLKKSILVTMDGTSTLSTVSKTLPSATDIRQHDVVATFYVSDAAMADLTSIRIEIRDSTSLNATRTYAVNKSITDFVAGHNWWTVKIPSIGGSGAQTGVDGNRELSASTFQRIKFYINTNIATDTPTIVIDSFRVVPSVTKASYYLTFDDAQSGDLVVANRLAELGLKGTFFVSPGLVDTADYLDKAELTQIQNQGNLIANHSWEHDLLLGATLTVSEAIDAITKSADWMYDNGFILGARIWATPGGNPQAWGWAEDWHILQDYCDIVRLTNSTSQAEGVFLLKDTYTTSFITDDADVPDASDPEDPDNLLNDVFYDNNATFILGFHNWIGAGNIVEGGVIQPNYDAFLVQLAADQAAGKVQTLTLDQVSFDTEASTGGGGYRSRYSGGGR